MGCQDRPVDSGGAAGRLEAPRHTTAAVGSQIFREGTLNPSEGASTLHCAQESVLVPGLA